MSAITNIVDFPEEVLIIIIKKLDFKSCVVLYNTCRRLRRIITMNNVITECRFSMNTWATPLSLQLSLFKDISGHLLKLNLSGVSNLTRDDLFNCLKSMERLEILDVGHTPIKIMDVVAVEKYCRNLIDITVNFVFRMDPLKYDIFPRCKKFFKNFKYVHFIGPPKYLIFNTLALNILEGADLDTIQFTVSDAYEIGPVTTLYRPINSLRFKKINIYLYHSYFNYFRNVINLEQTEVLKVLQENISQFIITCAKRNEIGQIYYSPAFKRQFDGHANAACLPKIQNIPYSCRNIVILLWSKDNEIDDSFHKQVEERLSNFPYSVRAKNELLPAQCKWICVNEVKTDEPNEDEPNEDEPNENEPNEEGSEAKKRCLEHKFVLDYNEILRGKEEMELSVIFKNAPLVNAEFPMDRSYLKKLTFLCLKGPLGCDAEFFAILIKDCTNLKTLSVISSTVFTPIVSLGRLLPLSQSIRNFRLVAKNINLRLLYSNLSTCIKLENIYIENINNVDRLPRFYNPFAIFQNCKKLYSFVLVNSFSSHYEKCEALKCIKRYQESRKRSHLNLNVLNNRDVFSRIPYYPFFEVFNETVLKQI